MLHCSQPVHGRDLSKSMILSLITIDLLMMISKARFHLSLKRFKILLLYPLAQWKGTPTVNVT